MFFLVTGASGVGKSTVRKLIEPQFADVLEAAELSMLGSSEMGDRMATSNGGADGTARARCSA